MNSKLPPTIKRLVGRLLVKAAYYTAIGTMLIPIGVLLVVEVPSWNQLAFWLIIAGLISFIAGWIYTIREERQKHADADREEKRKRIEEKQRQRESRAHLLVLSEIAKRQGVSMTRVARRLERWANEEESDEEEINHDYA